MGEIGEYTHYSVLGNRQYGSRQVHYYGWGFGDPSLSRAEGGYRPQKGASPRSNVAPRPL
jgi:hypothetical protein